MFKIDVSEMHSYSWPASTSTPRALSSPPKGSSELLRINWPSNSQSNTERDISTRNPVGAEQTAFRTSEPHNTEVLSQNTLGLELVH